MSTARFWRNSARADDHGVLGVADLGAGLIGEIVHHRLGGHVLELEDPKTRHASRTDSTGKFHGFGMPAAASTSFSTAAISPSTSLETLPAACTSPSSIVSIKTREHPYQSPVRSTSCPPLETSSPALATSISGAVHIDLRCCSHRPPNRNPLIFNEISRF